MESNIPLKKQVPLRSTTQKSGVLFVSFLLKARSEGSSAQADVAKSFAELQAVVSQLLPWLSEAASVEAVFFFEIFFNMVFLKVL